MSEVSVRTAVPRRPKVSYGASAVVTGAGSGMGRSFSREIAARGGQVVCADVNADRVKQTVAMIGEDKAHPVVCDVSSYDDVVGLADTARHWLQRPVDLVVNNAGIGVGGTPVGTVSMDDWEATIGINMWGMIYGCHVFTPALRAQGFGGIINVSSAASFGVAPYMGPYNVSKAGVLALSETLRGELSGTGVRVAALCPTGVKTGIMDSELARIAPGSQRMTQLGIKYAAMSPDKVARKTLNALDRGRFYVIPQPDAKLIWLFKRHMPRAYLLWLQGLSHIMPDH